MPAIIYKNVKHFEIVYNVIFSSMTCILSHLSYIVTRGQQCATEMTCIRKPICLAKLVYKLLFLYKHIANTHFGQNEIIYNIK